MTRNWKRSLAITAAALLLCVASTTRASVIWEANTNRGMTVFEGLERAPGTIDIQNDPKGVYGPVYHFNIWDLPEGGKERCEAKGTRLPDGTNYRLTNGNTYWIGWRSLYGDGIRQGQAWVALFQMHAYGATGMGAPFVLRTLNDGMLHLQNNVMGTNIHIWNAPLVTNQWLSFVMHVHMSPNANEGWIEFWYNGVRQTFINGQQRYYCPTHEDESGTYNRLKWGIYRGGGNSGNWHAWMSRARLGTSYADVDPGGSGGGNTWEAQTLSPVASGASTAMQNDTNATGGTWLALLADGAGDSVQFTTPSVDAGTYTLTLRYKAHPNRGILQASVDGTNLGGTVDQYSSTAGFVNRVLGTVTLAAGTHTIRLTCTGRNGSAGAYTLSADTFTLQ